LLDRDVVKRGSEISLLHDPERPMEKFIVQELLFKPPASHFFPQMLFQEQPSAASQEYVVNWAGTKPLAKKSQVLYPASVEEVQEIVRKHSSVRPVGSRLTYESLTAVASENGVLVDLSAMNGLIEIDCENNSAEFWAGTTIDFVSDKLREFEKYLNCSPGVIGIQTIAGALGTGTHGQGLSSNALCDAVIGGKLVIADGSVVTVTENDQDLLHAFRTHLGTLGVVVSVKIKLQDLNILTCTKATVPFQEFRKTYIELQRRIDFCKAWWFPNTNLVHMWSATEASLTDLSRYRANNSELYESKNTEAFDLLEKTINELENRMESDTRDSSHVGRQFETVNRFRNAVSVTGSLQQIFMKGIPVPQINCEIAIPLSKFDEALTALQKWVSGTQHKLHYPFIFRCTAGSSALLAPHRNEEVCWIGFLVYLAKDGTAKEGSFEMMYEIQKVLSEFGGTPHWGKHMCPELYNYNELMPTAHRFADIMHNLDPSGKFQNEWTRKFFTSLKPKLNLMAKL
jgi:FAD/FMN-containing dehydrogenase